MFSEVDNIIFPNRCEVIQLASHLFVYPIMKNGSSSFYIQIQHGLQKEWKIIKNQEIKSIAAPIITFIREPKNRFISGVNTYLYHLHRDNLNLDTQTILWFVNQYLFLDRHYCPQFFWLINLSRYCNADTLIEIQSMDSVNQYASINFDADVPKASEEFYKLIEKFNWNKLELYFYLDQILYDLIGQSLTYQQILDKIKNRPELYDLVFNQTKKICYHV